jgi:HPt (histidine-containing phosphotransfer) domain-containing protein
MSDRTHFADGEPLVSQLADRTHDDPEFAQLLEGFVKRLKERALAVEHTFREGDLAALAVMAHQLKGTAGGYGFPAIGEAAASLEKSAKTPQTLDEVGAQVARLIDLCRRARALPVPS